MDARYFPAPITDLLEMLAWRIWSQRTLVYLCASLLVWLLCCALRGATFSDQQHAVQNPGLNETDFWPHSTRNRNTPLVFIGGVPRSGTTLLRAMLDAHPDVGCGPQISVIPDLISMRAKASEPEEVLDEAVAAFILRILAKHGGTAPLLCVKDHFALMHVEHLATIFPNSKFILMIRDARAIIHSLISNKADTVWLRHADYAHGFVLWDSSVRVLFRQCEAIGPKRCTTLHYENLVLHPQKHMNKILRFIHLPWSKQVLQHEKYIGKPGGVFLSRSEEAAREVIKPIHMEPLSRWKEATPKDALKNISVLAPMLEVLGYDVSPHGLYGEPDPQVVKNTHKIQKNKAFWHKKAKEWK